MAQSLWLAVASSTLHAQSAQTPTLDFVVDAHAFALLQDEFGLTGEQRSRSQTCFERYAESRDALSFDLRRRAMDAGLREIEAENKRAQSENRHPSMSAELEAKNRDSMRVLIEGRREADQLLSSFIECLAVGIPLAADEITSVTRWIRRQNFLVRENKFNDFASTIDMCQLIESQLGSNVLLTEMRDGTTPDGERASAAIDRVLLEYTEAVDIVVGQMIDQRRTLTSKSLSFSDADDDFEQRMAKWSARFQRQFDVQERAARNFESLILEVRGEAAAASWRDAYLSMACPRLAAKRWPHGLTTWADRVEGMSPELHIEIARIADEYISDCARALEKAYAAGVKLKKGQFLTIDDRLTERDLEFGRAVIECHRASIECIQRVHRALPAEARGRLVQDLAKLRPDRFGPYLPQSIRDAVDSRGEYTPHWESVLR